MLLRCRRRADIVGPMPSWLRRGDLSCRGRGRCRRLVLCKAVEAALMQLRIGDWTAFSAHSCLPKAPIGFDEPIVTLALNDILSRGAARCRVSRQGGGCRQAGSQENQTCSSFEVHYKRLHMLDFVPETFVKCFHSSDIMSHTASLICSPASNLEVGRLRQRHLASSVFDFAAIRELIAFAAANPRLALYDVAARLRQPCALRLAP